MGGGLVVLKMRQISFHPRGKSVISRAQTRRLVCGTVLSPWWSCTQRMQSVCVVVAVKARLAPYCLVIQWPAGVVLPDGLLSASRGSRKRWKWMFSLFPFLPSPFVPPCSQRASLRQHNIVWLQVQMEWLRIWKTCTKWYQYVIRSEPECC